MAYHRPALTEIYAEIHLGPQDLGASFVELVAPLRDVGLTLVELSPIQQINLTATRINEQPSVTKNVLPRIRCWSADRTRLAQLSKNQVVVNLVGPYPGWAEFRRVFEGVYGAVRNRVPAMQVIALTLNTIDKMSPPTTNFTLGRYLNSGGPIVPRWYENSSEPSDIILGRGVLPVGGQNQQIKIKVMPMGVTFDIYMQCSFQRSLRPGDDILASLEELHTTSTQTFEDLITDTTRNDLLGGRVN